MCLVYVQVRNFVHIGNQKFKLGKIAVNRNARFVPMPAGKVARLGNPFFAEMKLKWILPPQLNAVVKCGRRQVGLKLFFYQGEIKNRKIKKGFRTSKAFQTKSFDLISLLQQQQSQVQQQLNQLQ